MDLVQVLGAGAGVVHGDGAAALVGHHLHRRHVGVAVADEDDAAKRNGARLLGHVAVHRRAVPVIVDAAVDAEQVLRLGGVVDRHAGPDRLVVLVVDELGGEHVLELIDDRAAANHLFDP